MSTRRGAPGERPDGTDGVPFGGLTFINNSPGASSPPPKNPLGAVQGPVNTIMVLPYNNLNQSSWVTSVGPAAECSAVQSSMTVVGPTTGDTAWSNVNKFLVYLYNVPQGAAQPTPGSETDLVVSWFWCVTNGDLIKSASVKFAPADYESSSLLSGFVDVTLVGTAGPIDPANIQSGWYRPGS